jgi:hypothetical protein
MLLLLMMLMIITAGEMRGRTVLCMYVARDFSVPPGERFGGTRPRSESFLVLITSLCWETGDECMWEKKGGKGGRLGDGRSLM